MSFMLKPLVASALALGGRNASRLLFSPPPPPPPPPPPECVFGVGTSDENVGDIRREEEEEE